MLNIENKNGPKENSSMETIIKAAKEYVRQEIFSEVIDGVQFTPTFFNIRTGQETNGEHFSVAHEVCKAFEDVFEDHVAHFNHLQFRGEALFEKNKEGVTFQDWWAAVNCFNRVKYEYVSRVIQSWKDGVDPTQLAFEGVIT